MKENTRFDAFHNAIRILLNLGDHEIEQAIGQEAAAMSDPKELRYSNPVLWFIHLPGDQAQAIYEKAIQPRQPERLRDIPIKMFFGFDMGDRAGDVTCISGVQITDAGGKTVTFSRMIPPGSA